MPDRFLIRFIRRHVERTNPQQPWRTAVSTLVALGAATALRGVLQPLLHTAAPFVTYFPTLMLVTVLGNTRAGVLTLLASPWFVWFLFMRDIPFAARIPYVAAFLLAGTSAVFFTHVLMKIARQSKDALSRESLANRELQHRVKNTLTVVQAIAQQSSKTLTDIGEFREMFVARVVALGRTHNIFSEQGWEHISLRRLVLDSVEPFDPMRFIIHGDDVEVDSEFAVSLGMCLHELATNALKHGALHSAEGRVVLDWRDHGGTLSFSWQEFCLDRVEESSRRGFGSRMLRAGPGSVTALHYDFLPSGVRWCIEFPAKPRGSEFFRPLAE